MSFDRIRLDRPIAGLQRMAARFGGHAFDPHRHETYGIGLTLSGVQQFHYRGSLHASHARQVLVLHPDELHDGHAGEGGTFAYRMLYLDPATVSQALDTRPPFVAEVVTNDWAMADIVDEAFLDFSEPLEPLAADATVGRMAELRRGGVTAPAGNPSAPSPCGPSPVHGISWWPKRIAPCDRTNSSA